jgi:hypothetical protein
MGLPLPEPPEKEIGAMSFLIAPICSIYFLADEISFAAKFTEICLIQWAA